jgi:hypothetical protein
MDSNRDEREVNMAIQKVSNQVQKHGVLQVAYASCAHATGVNGTSFADSGVYVTLNNVRAGSTIMMRIDTVFLHKTTGNFVYTQFLRDNAAFTDDTNGTRGLTVATATSYSPLTCVAIKTSETAGSHTYKLQWRTDAGTAETYGGALMTVMEIAA